MAGLLSSGSSEDFRLALEMDVSLKAEAKAKIAEAETRLKRLDALATKARASIRAADIARARPSLRPQFGVKRSGAAELDFGLFEIGTNGFGLKRGALFSRALPAVAGAAITGKTLQAASGYGVALRDRIARGQSPAMAIEATLGEGAKSVAVSVGSTVRGLAQTFGAEQAGLNIAALIYGTSVEKARENYERTLNSFKAAFISLSESELEKIREEAKNRRADLEFKTMTASDTMIRSWGLPASATTEIEAQARRLSSARAVRFEISQKAILEEEALKAKIDGGGA